MDDYIEETELAGIFVIKRPVIKDGRGFFREIFRKNELEKKLGYEFNPVQSNHSRSEKNVLRGIHIAPWHKLITVIRGQTMQVAVDLRENSPTFGKHITIKMGEDDFAGLFLPANCGNAYRVLSDEADYMYTVSQYWSKGVEKSVIWNDKILNINWKTNSPILSKKDSVNPTFAQIFSDEVDFLKK